MVYKQLSEHGAKVTEVHTIDLELLVVGHVLAHLTGLLLLVTV